MLQSGYGYSKNQLPCHAVHKNTGKHMVSSVAVGVAMFIECHFTFEKITQLLASNFNNGFSLKQL